MYSVDLLLREADQKERDKHSYLSIVGCCCIIVTPIRASNMIHHDEVVNYRHSSLVWLFHWVSDSWPGATRGDGVIRTMGLQGGWKKKHYKTILTVLFEQRRDLYDLHNRTLITKVTLLWLATRTALVWLSLCTCNRFVATAADEDLK